MLPLVGWLSASSEIVEEVRAVVNGSVITRYDVQDFKKKLKTGGLIDDILVQDPKAILSSESKVLDTLIGQKILDSEVKKQSFSVTSEQVDQEVRTVTRRNNINLEQLKAALKEQGVRFSDYQDFLKTRLERQALIEKAISSNIKITDEEVAYAYLKENPGVGSEVYEYKIAHILFLPKGGDVSAAEQRAQSTLNRLTAGETFDELASKYSEDPNFSEGGLLGTFKSGDFVKEIESGVKTLSPGDHSQIVRSRLGFHILKLLDKKIVSDPKFNRLKEQIRLNLYQQAFKNQFEFWLDKKRREAIIQRNS